MRNKHLTLLNTAIISELINDDIKNGACWSLYTSPLFIYSINQGVKEREKKRSTNMLFEYYQNSQQMGHVSNTSV